MYNSVIVFLVAYLLGNVSGGMILGKVFMHKDIREFGSKNAGTTNALRVFGLKIGIATFIIDFLKAFIACFIGFYMMGSEGTLIAAVGVVSGHNWPIFLNFKGGKGIASTTGFIFFFDYRIGIACLVFFILVAILSKYISLASILSSIAVNFFVYIFGYSQLEVYVTFGILSVLSIYRHRANIVRLVNGNENKFSVKKN